MPQPLLIHCPQAGQYLQQVVHIQAPPVFEDQYTFPSSLGNFISTGGTGDQFTSVLDGAPVVRTYDNFTINAGHIVTPSQRCKGLYLNIKGNLIVNGTLSMTARGAKALGKNVVIDPKYGRIYFVDTLDGGFDYTRFTIINKLGGLGVKPTSNVLPAINTNGACGCGGGTLNARGGNGTSFSGGAGGGGSVGYSPGSGSANANGTQGGDNGGAGGAGVYMGGDYAAQGGGGGAGNPGGTCRSAARNGSNGTGGLMILIVQGSVIFGANGSIQANGSNGGSSYSDGVGYFSSSGGGSGGGAVYLFAKGTVNSPNKITVSGGTTVGQLHIQGFSNAGSPGTIKIISL